MELFKDFPKDYVERVYAGVLGKMIGVYLGRPFEGWTYEHILSVLGEITYYVHDRFDLPLIVTDDDLSGTFTFLRALPDYGCSLDLTPEQIGQTWLNYIIEGRSILWWGGMGNSTEHTAYLRLKNGIRAPHSGSAERNGKGVSEQIGAQIFIDGWAMVAPGDPELAADLARRAASVSHDGEAIVAAQMIAALEAQAFVEPDIQRLLDTCLELIPDQSLIYRLIGELRALHAREQDWRDARAWLAEHYGYQRFPGVCHVIPNHGLIILSLLYGGGDFQQSMTIVNTSGWDTDCNAGNLGCLLGIRGGLAALERRVDTGVLNTEDWRSPLADRLYLPTADGGRVISDAVQETYQIVNIARRMRGQDILSPKYGARFHFDLPGSLQGFHDVQPGSPERIRLQIENSPGYSRLGQHCLALRYAHFASDQVSYAATATFIPPEASEMPGYKLMASPTLYPGQILKAGIMAGPNNERSVHCRLALDVYGTQDVLDTILGPQEELLPGEWATIIWKVEETNGAPIARVGLQITTVAPTTGVVYLDYLTWDGEPEVVFSRPSLPGTMWQRAWVKGVDQLHDHFLEAYRVTQNVGRGLLIQGTREWRNYTVRTEITPHLVECFGVAARVQGMQRYYALLLDRRGIARLVIVLDGEQTLAEAVFAWQFEQCYDLELRVIDDHLEGWINGHKLLAARDSAPRLDCGGIALVCEEGCIGADFIQVTLNSDFLLDEPG